MRSGPTSGAPRIGMLAPATVLWMPPDSHSFACRERWGTQVGNHSSPAVPWRSNRNARLKAIETQAGATQTRLFWRPFLLNAHVVAWACPPRVGDHRAVSAVTRRAPAFRYAPECSK